MKRMMIYTVCALAMMNGVAARAEAPPLSIYYQGRLLESSGDPVDGLVAGEVRLFTQETDGAAIWSQSLANISVVGGLYGFYFGDENLPDALNHSTVWLELDMDGTTLTPRQRMVSVPYALRAGTAKQLNPPMSGVPSGVVIMWSGTLVDIPDGWALCNGANGTPDLRERFVMGAAIEDDVGDIVGTNSLVLTASQLPAHAHTGTLGESGSHAHTAPNTVSAGAHTHGGGGINNSGNHSHSIRFGGYSETGRGRPGGQFGNYTQFAVSLVSVGNHTHTYSVGGGGSHTHTVTLNSAGDHTHAVTLNQTGGSAPIDNRPAYYAVAFIMKL